MVIYTVQSWQKKSKKSKKIEKKKKLKKIKMLGTISGALARSLIYIYSIQGFVYI